MNPRRKGAESTAAEKLGSGVRRRCSTHPQKAAAATTVLVVDDDPLTRSDVVCSALHAGYDALAVSDPQLALAICVKERPGVVICSGELPGLPAMKLARLLSLALGDRAPTFMIYTAEDPAQFADPQVAVSLSKPVDPTRLRLVLDLWVEKRRADVG